MSPNTLAVDLVQTGFRARVTVDGRLAGEVAGPGYVSGTALEDALTAVARQATQLTGTAAFDSVAAGMTGAFGHVPDIAAAARQLQREFGTTRLVVADDAVTSYLGVLGERCGVVVAAGTGLVALGRGRGGDWARVDGVGAMIGDEGAGWRIGRQGMIVALSAADGRAGSSHRLLAGVSRLFRF